jgi:Uma2 family endonuclease
MLEAKYIPRYTVEDYMMWKGDWELIDGVPFAMTPSPFGKHQKLTAKISHFILSEFEKCPETEISAYVELDWIVNDTTVLRPDVSITCKDIEEFIKEPPEAVFEVVSKSTVLKDEEVKFSIYEKEGVKYYIIVYPDIKKVRGFKLKRKKYEKFFDSDEGILKLQLCNKCEIKINVNKLFR